MLNFLCCGVFFLLFYLDQRIVYFKQMKFSSSPFFLFYLSISGDNQSGCNIHFDLYVVGGFLLSICLYISGQILGQLGLYLVRTFFLKVR